MKLLAQSHGRRSRRCTAVAVAVASGAVAAAVASAGASALAASHAPQGNYRGPVRLAPAISVPAPQGTNYRGPARSPGRAGVAQHSNLPAPGTSR